MGPAAIVILLLFLFPIVTCMSMALIAAGLGFLLKKEVDEEFVDTELLAMGELG